MNTLNTPENRAKAAATRQARKDKVNRAIKLWERAVQQVTNKHRGPHFMAGGTGVCCFIWVVAEINDGRKVRAFRFLAAYGDSLVESAAFRADMMSLPGIVSYSVVLD